MLSTLVVENHFEDQTLVMLRAKTIQYKIARHNTQRKLFQNFPVNVEEIIVNLSVILICFQGNNFAHFTLTMQCISSKAVNNAAVMFSSKIK